jgi:hypothetical protein
MVVIVIFQNPVYAALRGEFAATIAIAVANKRTIPLAASICRKRINGFVSRSIGRSSFSE